MKKGRKVYFNAITGEILQSANPGEMEGSVRITTLEDDFPNGVPENCDFIQLAYGERTEEFQNVGSMHVDLETRQLIICPRLTINTDKTQIQADGADTATITSDYAESFCVDDGEDYAVNPLLFSSTIPGTYKITAKSALHGDASLFVEVI